MNTYNFSKKMSRLLQVAIVTSVAFGCADRHAACVEAAQSNYAAANPEKTYSQLVAKRQVFDRQCPK
jgi:hypothetical protein